MQEVFYPFLLPGLLKLFVADEDTTDSAKLRMRQHQQVRYYNREARDLEPLEKDDAVRV